MKQTPTAAGRLFPYRAQRSPDLLGLFSSSTLKIYRSISVLFRQASDAVAHAEDAGLWRFVRWSPVRRAYPGFFRCSRLHRDSRFRSLGWGFLDNQCALRFRTVFW